MTLPHKVHLAHLGAFSEPPPLSAFRKGAGIFACARSCNQKNEHTRIPVYGVMGLNKTNTNQF